MDSRGKRILSLALNKQLAVSISSFKPPLKRQKLNEISDDDDNDDDYIPDDSSSDTESYEKTSPKTLTCANSKIKILSNILIHRPLKKSDQKDKSGIQENEHIREEFKIENLHDSKSVVTKILDEICQNVVLLTFNQSLYTKKGHLRKRKKYNLSVNERKLLKQADIKKKHRVKSLCSTHCKKKCQNKINAERQEDINKQFWMMTKDDRSTYMLNNVSKIARKRNTTGRPDSRRSRTYFYSFKDQNGEKQDVCRKFFLGVLGYENNNDKVLRNVLTKTKDKSLTANKDKRGSKNCNRKIDRDIIISHIKSFNPTVAHYRREHAPKRLYLPSDISITSMYQDFKEKHPRYQFSYYLYRSVVSSMNISFAKLGNEECWQCEKFTLHEKETEHRKDSLNTNCEDCNVFKSHWEKYVEARIRYKNDSENKNADKLVVSADLEKVIMLPRCDTFKEVMFTPRIIAYNESFVVTGKNNIPTAVIWHEAITGRSKQDIASTFYAFFISIRDTKNVVLWLDNCSSQNKNWNLYCSFIYIMNSSEVAFETLTVRYFEPGHSFMAADWFHHQVERSLKSKGKVYDFKDFSDAIQSSTSKVKIISMDINNFFNWEDCTSQYKLNKINPRPYLNQIVEVAFVKNKMTMSYKTSFEATPIELNFLGAKYMKQGINKPQSKSNYRGIAPERKNAILSKLCAIMPENRIQFWKNLPLSPTLVETDLSDDE